MMPGSHRARCSSVPNWSSVGPICRSANHDGGDRGAGADQRLEHDEPLEAAAPAAAVLDRPGHAQPAARAELLGEGAVVADDPRVLGDLGPLGRRPPDLERLVAQGLQLGGEGEVHGRRR